MARGANIRITGRGVAVGLWGALALGGGCGDDGAPGPDDAANDDGTSTGSAADLPEGCDLYVEPSDDDQTAVQEALIDVQTGQILCLAAGSYTFTRQLSLDAEGVTVRGAGGDQTILDFSGQISGGNGLLVTGDDVVLEQFQVLDPPGDGIRADKVKNVSFVGIDVIWTAAESLDNGAYGLYPVQSDGVIIRDCLVQGSRDAGIYVGQSTNILVEDSEARGNVAGIEIENSTDAIVRRNHAHDNTAGILVFNLPGLDIGDGKRANVYENVVENNNLGNFGEPGTIVQIVPPGIGVLILAADHNEVWNNEIRGNDSTGIIIITYVDDLFAPPDDPEFDIYAEGNWVHGNTMEGNGENPDDLISVLTELAMPAPDVIFDGCVDAEKDNGDGRLSNCVSDLGSARFFAGTLCGQGMSETDPAGHTCEQTPLPTEL